MVFNRHEIGLPGNLLLPNGSIEFVSYFKLLGVVLDSKLTFSEHVSSICKKVNSKSFLLSRNTKIFSCSFRCILFKLFILPNFDFCSSVFSVVNKTEIKRLESCFNRSLRQLIKAPVDRHNLRNFSYLLSPFKIVPLRIRLFQRYALLVFRVFSRSNIKSICDRIKRCDRSLRNPFLQPDFLSSYGESSFSNVATKLLNKFVYSFIQRPSPIARSSENELKRLLNSNIFYYFDNFKDIF